MNASDIVRVSDHEDELMTGKEDEHSDIAVVAVVDLDEDTEEGEQDNKGRH